MFKVIKYRMTAGKYTTTSFVPIRELRLLTLKDKARIETKQVHYVRMYNKTKLSQCGSDKKAHSGNLHVNTDRCK